MSRSMRHWRPYLIVCASVPAGCALGGYFTARSGGLAHTSPPPPEFHSDGQATRLPARDQP